MTVRRLKRDLTGKRFRTARSRSSLHAGTANRMFSLLDDIVTRSAEAERHQTGRRHCDHAAQKRFLSSPFAFGMTISHYRDARAGRGLRDDEYDDIFGEGQADEEEGLWERRGRATARVQASDPLSAAEPGQLEKLADWG